MPPFRKKVMKVGTARIATHDSQSNMSASQVAPIFWGLAQGGKFFGPD
jgi:hypothetical protein